MLSLFKWLLRVIRNWFFPVPGEVRELRRISLPISNRKLKRMELMERLEARPYKVVTIKNGNGRKTILYYSK